MSYFYAIRKGAPNDTIVLMDEDGAPLDSGSTVVIRGEGFNEFFSLEDDDAEFPIREEFIMAFIDGCIYDLGVANDKAFARYNEAMRRFRGKKVSNKYQTAQVRPHNMRGDRYTYGRTDRRDV